MFQDIASEVFRQDILPHLGRYNLNELTPTIVQKFYYEFWEGRITTNYNPATGEQIQRTVTGASQAIVIQRMREILNPTEAAEIKPTVEVKSDIKPESQSLKEWSQLWVDGLVGVKSSSVFVYKRDLELYIIPFFGGMDLREIEKKRCEEMGKKVK